MKYTRYDVKSKRKKDDWKTMIIMIVGVVILAVLIGSLVFFKVFPKGGELLGGSKKPSTQQGGNKNGGNTIPPVVADDKEKEEDATNQKDEENTAGKNNDLITKAEESTYTMVQCGYFSKKESAEKVKNEVGSIAQVINEDEKFRVVSYIGEENKAQELSKTLTEKEIDNTKTRFTIATNTISNKAIKETIDGLLDISVKLAKDDISGINTKDFKAWTNSLKENKDDET
ncbi:MAG: hypothetical protein ACRCX8_16405, partial [Sarcina sp.]